MTTPEQKRDYQRAYSRGLATGRRYVWPDHRPPAPPDEIVGPIVKAAQELRDALDGELAKFDPDDELNLQLGPLIDRLDAAMVGLTNWLTAIPPTPESETQ